jgi:multicomponent Na+:H+ antiporter subunit D
MTEFLPPALILVAAALLIGPLRGHARSAVVLLAPLATLWAVWQVPDGVVTTVSFLDYQIEPVEGSALRRLFATIFALMAFVGGLYAFRQARWYELAAGYAYAAGAVGVSFAGDLITLFIFWELMALFSTVIVWCGGTPEAKAAGMRYAVMHLFGGIILKVGIEGVVIHTGSIDIQPMLATNFDTWMVLIGLYHQDRGAGVDTVVPGRTRADLDRHLHDHVRHHLCATRERRAQDSGLLDRQPGWFHGVRHRYRHPDGAQRCRGPRLRAHYL